VKRAGFGRGGGTRNALSFRTDKGGGKGRWEKEKGGVHQLLLWNGGGKRKKQGKKKKEEKKRSPLLLVERGGRKEEPGEEKGLPFLWIREEGSEEGKKEGGGEGGGKIRFTLPRKGGTRSFLLMGKKNQEVRRRDRKLITNPQQRDKGGGKSPLKIPKGGEKRGRKEKEEGGGGCE